MAPTHQRWTRDQLLIALSLYCELPFGQMHKGNARIRELAARLGRTPDAVAMKLGNLASLDPAITGTGRRGLPGASELDRQVWAEFSREPARIALEMTRAIRDLGVASSAQLAAEEPSDYTGTTRLAQVEQRIGQGLFRRAVLSSYDFRCCITDVSDPRLLVASHIVPWSESEPARLNPRNGLCLSTLYDRAFDIGLITVTPELVVRVSPQLEAQRGNDFIRRTLLERDGFRIRPPSKFEPDRAALAWHVSTKFLER